MMTTGQLVMHETAGVCRVDGETTLDGMPGKYYVLTPLYLNDAKFYTPQNGSKVKIRPVMTSAEAQELIDRLPEVPPITFENLNDQKTRSAAILKSADSYQLAGLAKTLYQDQLRRSRQNKRSGVTDTTVLKKVETLLFGELATALDLEYQQVLGYIEQHLK
ncbi:MAG: CarD family transcriptional regulator [Oscillospiraceae bacterium]|nr:CarD family transcriptional regulator [Oscillospiraceae bacterium]